MSLDLFGRKSKEQLHYVKRKASHWKFVAKMREQKIELLEARIVAQKEDIARLIEHNRLLANPPKYERSLTPIHVSEDQEDIKFAKDTGMLSLAEAEDMLRELDFDNPQAVMDDGELSNLTLF